MVFEDSNCQQLSPYCSRPQYMSTAGENIHAAFEDQVHVDVPITLALVYLNGGLKYKYINLLLDGADEVAEILLSQNAAAFCLLG